jgi:hypothetical protein
MITIRQILEAFNDIPYHERDRFSEFNSGRTSEYSDKNEKHKETINKIAEPLTNHYNFGPTNSLKRGEDMKAIKSYTSSSRDTNMFLHDHHYNNNGKRFEPVEAHKDTIPHQIKKLDNALAKHQTPKPITVFSGIKHDPRTKMDANKIVHHPAYLSTSINHHQAEGFGLNDDESGPSQSRKGRNEVIHHVLKIHVPKGSTGAYVDHISSVSGEREFILPRGANLKHNHTTTEEHHVPGTDNLHSVYHFHNMTLQKQHHVEYVEPKKEFPDNGKSREWGNANIIHRELSKPIGSKSDSYNKKDTIHPNDFEYHFNKNVKKDSMSRPASEPNAPEAPWPKNALKFHAEKEAKEKEKNYQYVMNVGGIHNKHDSKLHRTLAKPIGSHEATSSELKQKGHQSPWNHSYDLEKITMSKHIDNRPASEPNAPEAPWPKNSPNHPSKKKGLRDIAAKNFHKEKMASAGVEDTFNSPEWKNTFDEKSYSKSLKAGLLDKKGASEKDKTDYLNHFDKKYPDNQSVHDFLAQRKLKANVKNGLFISHEKNS